MSAVVSSHGADFFGVDHHPAADLATLADHVRAHLSLERGRVRLAQLLEQAGEKSQEVPAAQATDFAAMLRQLARERYLRPSVARRARALGDAAARAGAAGEPWTLTPATA